MYSGDDFYSDEITSPLLRPNTICPLACEDEHPRPSTRPSADYFIPTADWIRSVKVGDLVPDCFGLMAEVVSISAQRDNIDGDPFICLYTRLSNTSQVSGGFTAGKLHRSTKITARHTSAELDAIEKRFHG